MIKLCFVDTETTSLRHDRRAWEIAIITRDEDGKDEEHTWFIDSDDIDLGNADLMSLKIGKFFDRHPQARTDEIDVEVAVDFENESYVLLQAEVLLRGATIVGAVPNFDTEVLANRMRANGICPSWHYHLVDVETLAAGALRLPPPWSFDAVLEAYGLTYDEADRHTALGDARMVRDLYDAVFAGQPAEPATDDKGRWTQEELDAAKASAAARYQRLKPLLDVPGDLDQANTADTETPKRASGGILPGGVVYNTQPDPVETYRAVTDQIAKELRMRPGGTLGAA